MKKRRKDKMCVEQGVYFEQNSNNKYCRWRVVWKDGDELKTKSFNCLKLFPNYTREDAILNTMKVAIDFKLNGYANAA